MARLGRPRLTDSTRPGMTTEDEILDAAAELFTTKGYAATSTRQIAESVGMRQASLFHHFPTKQALLEAVIATSSGQIVRFVKALGRDPHGPRLRLHALLQADARHVMASRWNIGALLRLPELRDAGVSDVLAGFDSIRKLYETLTSAARREAGLPANRFLVRTSYEFVEVLIGARLDGRIDACDEAEFADAAFRYLELQPLGDQDRIAVKGILGEHWGDGSGGGRR